MSKLPLGMRWAFFKLRVREALCRRYGHKMGTEPVPVKVETEQGVELAARARVCLRCRGAFVTLLEDAPPGSWLKFTYDTRQTNAVKKVQSKA